MSNETQVTATPATTASEAQEAPMTKEQTPATATKEAPPPAPAAASDSAPTRTVFGADCDE